MEHILQNYQMFGSQMLIHILVLMLLTTLVHTVVVQRQVFTVIIHLQDQIQNLIV